MIKVNTRYFKWLVNENNEDILDVIMVNKFFNEKTISITHIKDYKPHEREKVSIDDIINDYTELVPDGYVTFSIVSIGNDAKDIIVTFIREEDRLTNTPYAVCRQMITDLFANQLYSNHIYYGISISKDSCPADINFDNFFSCSKIIRSEVISYYIGDSLDSIIHSVTTKMYDDMNNILNNNFLKYVKQLAGDVDFLYKQYAKQEVSSGMCRNIETLLSLNNFMNDIYFGLKIIPLNISVTDEILSQGFLPDEYVSILSNILRENIYKTMILKYDKDIDLNDIERKYTLIVDINNNVYIVAYITNGEYHIPVENLESEENMDKLNNLADMVSVRKAYNEIIMNRNKYV